MIKFLQTQITGIGDPFILLYKDTYYHYSTSAKDGFLVYTSKDLFEWENKGYCYQNSKVGSKDFWAPEVYHYKGDFYMFLSAYNDHHKRLMISVAKSHSPLGPFEDVYDRPTFDFDYAAIDASLYIENDRVYMFYARDCSENVVDGIHKSEIYGVELTDDLLSLKGQPIKLLSPEGPYETRDKDWQWNEGPSLLKEGDTYFMTYSTNCFLDKHYAVSYATSKSPLGPYVKAKENPILSYIDGYISGPGHNAFFETREGLKMTSFHVHTHMDMPSGDRTTCFCAYDIENNKLVINYK